MNNNTKTTKDYLKEKLSKEKIRNIVILVVILLLFIALVIIANKLYERYGVEIYQNLQVFAFINLVIVGGTLFFVLLFIFSGPRQQIYKDHEIQNLHLSKEEVEKNFDELVEEYLIKYDEKYHKDMRRKKRLGFILLGLTSILLLAYIPFILLQENLLAYLRIYELFKDLTLMELQFFKIILDFTIIAPFAFVFLNCMERILKRQKVLAAAYQKYLQKEIGVRRREIGTIINPGKGVTIKEKYNIDLSRISKDALAPEEKIALLHDHAKYLSNKHGNYKTKMGIGLLLALEVFCVSFLVMPLGVSFLPFVYLFILILVISIVLSEKQGNYHRKAQLVLGTYTIPGEDRELLEFNRILEEEGRTAATAAYSEIMRKIEEMLKHEGKTAVAKTYPTTIEIMDYKEEQEKEELNL